MDTTVATGMRKSRIQGTPPQRPGSTEMRVNAMAQIDSGNDRTSCPDAGAKLHTRTESVFVKRRSARISTSQIGVRSSFVRVVLGDASGSWRRTPSRLSQAVPRLFACDLEPPGQRRR